MLFAAVLVLAIIEALVIIVVLLHHKTDYDGTMVVKDAGTKKMFTLELDVDLDTLHKRSDITLKVDDQTF